MNRVLYRLWCGFCYLAFMSLPVSLALEINELTGCKLACYAYGFEDEGSPSLSKGVSENAPF